MIYLDHNASTPLHPLALQAMLPFLKESYGNPNSLHRAGAEGRKAISRSRKEIADALQPANPNEIFFTSGASESNNWVLQSLADLTKNSKRHFIISSIEHHCVLNTCRELEKNGLSVSYLSVNSNGKIDIDELKKLIRPETFLISVMYANNEVGTIQPIEKIGTLAKEKGILFHCDAVQVIGKFPICLKELPVDYLSGSAHKFYGPKGTGFLYARQGVPLHPFIFGGEQELGKRAGTENVAGIVGMAAALKACMETREEDFIKVKNLTLDLWKGIEKKIPGAIINGPDLQDKNRLPGTLNLSFPGAEGESLLMTLDLEGIAVSTGAACASGAIEPSHVLTAMGRKPEEIRSSLRLSLGKDNTKEEMEKVVQVLSSVTQRLRTMMEAT